MSSPDATDSVKIFSTKNPDDYWAIKSHLEADSIPYWVKNNFSGKFSGIRVDLDYETFIYVRLENKKNAQKIVSKYVEKKRAMGAEKDGIRPSLKGLMSSWINEVRNIFWKP